MKYIFASANKGKVKEVKDIILKKYPSASVLSLSDISFTEDIVEDGSSFRENALIKAIAVLNFLKERKIYTDYKIIADDSGLCVDALNGEPGIYSARYAKDHDNDANIKKLLDNLENKKDRKAHYKCAMVMLFPDETYILSEEQTNGEILKEKHGDNGFCYDPYFYSFDLKKSFGDATLEEKNSVSHRFKALEKLLEYEEADSKKPTIF